MILCLRKKTDDKKEEPMSEEVKESKMSGLYSLKNILDKNPIQLSGAVMAVLNVPIVAGAIDWSTATVAAANVALVAVLGLFISAKTSNDAVLQEMAEGQNIVVNSLSTFHPVGTVLNTEDEEKVDEA